MNNATPLCATFASARRLIAALSVVTIAALAGLAGTVSIGSAQQPIPIPAYTGYVNDFANVIPAETRAALESLSERVNAATKGDMVIVTMKDIGDRAASDVALNIGRQWKVGANTAIGDKARNAGVIILLVPKESSSTNSGSCFIATGQGAEGFITDATSGSICREATPYFRQQDYAGGLQLVAQRVAQRYATEFNVSFDAGPLPAPPPQRNSTGQSSRGGGGTSIVTILVIIFVILSMLRGGRGGLLRWLPFILSSGGGGRNNRWGGGGGGGGFGGGGGGFGGFGGGGGFSGGGGGSNW
ncbi:MAG: TPM domain-containing protein [Gemmatimonas sp.]